jgi:integrase/recombinase XerC
MSSLATVQTASIAPATLTREARVSWLVSVWLANRAETTVRAYQKDLEGWAEWLGRSPAQAVEDLLSLDAGGANALAMAYRASLLERGLSPATVNRRLAALRSLVDAARTVGLVTWTLSVSGVRAQAYRDTRGPGVSGYRAMLGVLSGSDPQSLRDRALLAMLYTMALRRAEVIALNVEDLDLEGARAWIVGKGKSEREAVTVPAQTLEALRAWLEVRGFEDGPLFISLDRRLLGSLARPSLNAVTRRVREIGREAGVKVSPHGLRHAGITRALDLTGGDARKVRALSRHSKLETLMLYDDARRDAGGEVSALLALDV